jgi:hypothetical protein
MEIRNTPPPLPFPEWQDDPLTEELCLALRLIGVLNGQLPDGEQVRAAIRRVQEIHHELARRSLAIGPRIRRLSTEMGWDIETLLHDSLVYPQAIPYLAQRPDPTCGNCGKGIPRTAILALCQECVEKGLEIIASGHSESHLEACTVCGKAERGFLMYAYGLEWMNYCTDCLQKALTRYNTAH